MVNIVYEQDLNTIKSIDDQLGLGYLEFNVAWINTNIIIPVDKSDELVIHFLIVLQTDTWKLSYHF